MKIIDFYSPNFNKKKRSRSLIRVLVIHYTGMQSERESLLRLCDSKFKVSCHFFINEKGKIYRLVKENKIAWHAGKSCWGKLKNLNKNSIGIELVNSGHKYGYKNFKKKQILSLIKLSRILIKKYKIKDKNIVGHSDVAPERKIDPGEKFPWKELAKKKIGIWHKCEATLLRKLRKIEVFQKKDKERFIKNLNKIGYCFSRKKNFSFKKTLKAFQRHHRTELINGNLDQECLVIAKNLTKNL